MKIFITGSESTGKTEMARYLANRFGVPWVPEYAREYIQVLNRPYTYSDVEEIARFQLRQIEKNDSHELVFFDTGLIITRVWFRRKFGEIPTWFEQVFSVYSQGYYLICHYDLPWMPDPVRENPNIRQVLDNEYVNEIKALELTHDRVSGIGTIRQENAYRIVNEWLALKNE